MATSEVKFKEVPTVDELIEQLTKLNQADRKAGIGCCVQHARTKSLSPMSRRMTNPHFRSIAFSLEVLASSDAEDRSGCRPWLGSGHR